MPGVFFCLKTKRDRRCTHTNDECAPDVPRDALIKSAQDRQEKGVETRPLLSSCRALLSTNIYCTLQQHGEVERSYSAGAPSAEQRAKLIDVSWDGVR